MEELTQQLQEERAVSRREKLTVATLQREVARNKSEGPMVSTHHCIILVLINWNLSLMQNVASLSLFLSVLL